MAIFYLIGSVFFSVIILILAFENIQATCTYLAVFFYPLSGNVSPTFLIFAISLLGMINGAFFYGFLHSLFSKGSSSDEEELL